MVKQFSSRCYPGFNPYTTKEVDYPINLWLKDLHKAMIIKSGVSERIEEWATATEYIHTADKEQKGKQHND